MRVLIAAAAFSALSFGGAAQDTPADSLSRDAAKADSLVLAADSLHMNYDFSKAVDLYEKALECISDSVAAVSVRDRLLFSVNGESMLGFMSDPVVVARKCFPKDEFFLYFPLDDGCWRPVPNILDTLGADKFAEAVYFPENCSKAYFSAPGKDGTRDIYTTVKTDTVWTLPSFAGEFLNSAGDEIYPMLSPDGKTMYFASSGLYGAGGFDLYSSSWNEEEKRWEVPVNMGFPYSSPYNDFLFINTPDWKYTVFASDRGCSADSVCVYVLEYDSMPVRREVKDVGKVRSIMSLQPQVLQKGSSGEAVIPENVDTKKYMDQMAMVRSLMDTIDAYGRALEDYRSMFAESDDEAERERLTAEILMRESEIPVLKKSLEKARLQLDEIEMEFLFSGVLIDPDTVMDEADSGNPSGPERYGFRKACAGTPLDIRFERPVEVFDYSFMILEEGRLAENQTLPSGLVFQIQLFNVGAQVTPDKFKGLSPVYCKGQASGRYTYSVGVFRTYGEADSHLEAVKKLGFKTAYITAYMDGVPVNVNKVRTTVNDK